jgi:hypothetical protein
MEMEMHSHRSIKSTASSCCDRDGRVRSCGVSLAEILAFAAIVKRADEAELAARGAMAELAEIPQWIRPGTGSSSRSR